MTHGAVTEPPAPRRERPWYAAIPVSLWVIGAFVGTAIGIGFLGVALTTVFRAKGRIDPNVYVVVASAVIYVVALVIILGLPRLLKRWSSRVRYRELLGLTRMMTWKDIGYGVIGFVVYLAAWVGVSYLLQSLVPGFDLTQKQKTGFSSTLSPSSAVVVFFALVVLAPLAEEILFRGYLFGTLRRCLPVVIAAVLTSALFGLVHGQWNVAADVFVMSMVSCYLRFRTGAIWSSVLLHMTKNALAFYLLYVATRSIM